MDLRHREGLSLVAGLVGDPKETDDFTKNLVSLTLSHVKVELDITAPALSVVEFERENGEVVEVFVTYPWLSPTFSHCKELGHVIRNCLKWIPPLKDVHPPEKQAPKNSEKSQGKKKVTSNVKAIYVPIVKDKAPSSDQATMDAESIPPGEITLLVFTSQAPFSKSNVPSPNPKTAIFSQSKSFRPPKISSTLSLLALSSFIPDPYHLSPPGPLDRRVLKRSRSDPLSPLFLFINLMLPLCLKEYQIPLLL